MNHIMIDLETMGACSDAAIVAIGAVAFDPLAKELGGEFYRHIDLNSSMKNGGKVEAGTIIWWLRQSESARAELTGGGGLRIVDALEELHSWITSISNQDTVRVWGNGASFDNVILRSAFERAFSHAPWKFYNDRCYRTLKNLYPNVAFDRSGVHHHALHDAISQARHLLAIVEKGAVIE